MSKDLRWDAIDLGIRFLRNRNLPEADVALGQLEVLLDTIEKAEQENEALKGKLITVTNLASTLSVCREGSTPYEEAVVKLKEFKGGAL